MQSTFTGDDVGKAVETSSGDVVGIVGATDPETAYVKPDPEMDDSAIATLGWERRSDAVPLADDAVERITDESLVLDASLSAEDIVSGATSPDDERQVSEPNVGKAEYAPDETVTNDGEASPPSGPDTEFDPATDAGGRIDGDEERRSAPAGNPADELDAMAEADAIDEEEVASDMDVGETTDATEGNERSDEERPRELDVDPTELTQQDPEAEVRSGEDVGDRTDTEIDSERLRDDTTGPSDPIGDEGEGSRRAEDARTDDEDES